jgi:two-component system cell cycle response regulator DivK
MPTALIVDDSERNRRLARDLLNAAGFRTLEAATGAAAVALAVDHVLDVILMDLRLPDMDGTEAVRALRVAKATSRTPVVAMSALRVEGSGDWLEEAGFAGWLEKPIRVGTFADEVRAYCAGP